MDIQKINEELGELWATNISQTILDLNEPSIEFRLTAIHNADISVYRLRCSGLIGFEYVTQPVHSYYSELTAVEAEKIMHDGTDAIRISLEIWSEEMVVRCLSVDVEIVAQDNSRQAGSGRKRPFDFVKFH